MKEVVGNESCLGGRFGVNEKSARAKKNAIKEKTLGFSMVILRAGGS